MNTLIKRLPLFAFVLAAFAAFAFTSPKSLTGEYGEESNVWYDVSTTDPGVDTYQCDTDLSENCLFDQPFGMGSPISGQTGKIFVVNDAENLIPA